MGNILGRSSSAKSQEKRARKRKAKEDLQDIQTPCFSDAYFNHLTNDKQIYDGTLMHPFDGWNQSMEQQHMVNFNDPPGAPRTYPPSFPMIQNDVMNQVWQPRHDFDNNFYMMNSVSMANATNISYDSNQFVHSQNMNASMNPNQQAVPEERVSKRVQFAHPIQQEPLTHTPLTNTRSWNEPNVSIHEPTYPLKRHESSTDRQTTQRPITSTFNASAVQTNIQKPIYIGIDHKATLAERGQKAARKRHHTNDEKRKAELQESPSTANHRTHAHHQHKRQESNEPLNFKTDNQSNKANQLPPMKPSGAHRTATPTPASIIIPNKAEHVSEQSISTDVNTRITKRRHNHQSPIQRTEQRSTGEASIQSSKHKANRAIQRPPLSNLPEIRNNSPSNLESNRRTEILRGGTPVTKIQLTNQQQQWQKSSLSSSGGTASMSSTRSHI